MGARVGAGGWMETFGRAGGAKPGHPCPVFRAPPVNPS